MEPLNVKAGKDLINLTDFRQAWTVTAFHSRNQQTYCILMNHIVHLIYKKYVHLSINHQ